jgi:hypothetical protein
MNKLFPFAAAALALLADVGPASAQFDMPDPGYVPEPPPLVWDTIPYGGKRRDQIRRVKNRLKGKPAIVIWVDSAGSVGENYRYETGWMPFYLFDNRFAVAGVHPWHRKQLPTIEHLARTAEGIAEIVRRADKFGYDGSRLILVGEGGPGRLRRCSAPTRPGCRRPACHSTACAASSCSTPPASTSPAI